MCRPNYYLFIIILLLIIKLYYLEGAGTARYCIFVINFAKEVKILFYNAFYIKGLILEQAYFLTNMLYLVGNLYFQFV